LRERAILLENPFLIRIGSRDPGPHILAKQRLVGAGNKLFAFSGFRAMVVATLFLVAIACFFFFRSPLCIVFKSFIPFGIFFTLKNQTIQPPPQTALQNRRWSKPHGGAPLPLGVWPLLLPLPTLRETFCIWLHRCPDKTAGDKTSGGTKCPAKKRLAA
jgi:hypothetical protein